MHPAIAKALYQARLQTSELELDVLAKRREIKAFASLVEKSGVKKSTVDRWRSEAKQVVRLKSSADENEIEDLINPFQTNEKGPHSGKSPKKEKRARKFKTKRAKTAYNYYAQEKLREYKENGNSIHTQSRMSEIGAAWKSLKASDADTSKYEQLAADDKLRHTSEMAVELEMGGCNTDQPNTDQPNTEKEEPMCESESVNIATESATHQESDSESASNSDSE